MIPGTTSNSATGGIAGQSSSGVSAGTSKPVDKNMFLELLVAQLRNQDPMHPGDGTQFVAQLAQFQQLEQAVNTGQDISTIREDLDQLLTTPVAQS